MTKSQLVRGIADRQSLLAMRDVNLAVKTMVEHMTACLAAGGRIEIRGFGGFTMHYRRGRVGRNPRMGRPVSVPARYVPYRGPVPVER